MPLRTIVTVFTRTQVWLRRIRLAGTVAVSITALVGVVTSALDAYSTLQEAKQASQQASQDIRLSYEALVAKTNSLAERLAYLEGSCGKVSVSPSPPLPPPPRGLHSELMMAQPVMESPEPPQEFQIEVYQPLPGNLDSLIEHQQTFRGSTPK